ncbi:hypothetical protein GQ55_9G498000 [Panicum hallii var. hallii]|uniref:Uncharacterized protein n=1 Tax=Panicum hallii var. hallii TaxID=1504633 RepID=A0A2T7CDM1_9POAL|nr:hypothetical protein GQ55_9G498000 [Panicum hallii var. hallii]
MPCAVLSRGALLGKGNAISLCLLLLLFSLLFLGMAWIPSCPSIVCAQGPFRFTIWN